MKLVFISDLHLSPDSERNNQIFYKLLKQWKNEIDALYILGDFFDYWLGDDDSNAFIEMMKSHLLEFSKIKPIYYIHGNHDFAIGNRFAKETGVKILQDCSIIEVAGNRILLSHGDTFCSLDIQYQRMKKILRNPILIAILRRCPLLWRRKLKDLLEHKASNSLDSKPKFIYHVVDKTVLKFALKNAANIVIHGHTHNPGKYAINFANNDLAHEKNTSKLKSQENITRVEIPDWVDRDPGGYVLIEDLEITICK